MNFGNYLGKHYSNIDPKIAGLVIEDNSKSKAINMYLQDFESNFVFCQAQEPFKVLQKKIHNRYYEAPKIIPDVFEALLGAVFADGGYNNVVKVLQHTLGPFVWMVAKYFEKIRKNPIEEFNLFWSSKGLTPRVETYVLGATKERNCYDTDDEDNQDYGYPFSEQPKDKPLVNFKCAIIYKGKKQLWKSYGNTKEQAKKNSCILGYAKLREELRQAGELDPSIDGFINSSESMETHNKLNEVHHEVEGIQESSSDGWMEEESDEDIYS